ncbi:uncharacterized protein [Prorops nasuta]|uniref:uncharacterized protein isoform X2 n=1 Tax=Prorops nasuta TaxID=863751 RepID=UPI0034D0192D
MYVYVIYVKSKIKNMVEADSIRGFQQYKKDKRQIFKVSKTGEKIIIIDINVNKKILKKRIDIKRVRIPKINNISAYEQVKDYSKELSKEKLYAKKTRKMPQIVQMEEAVNKENTN